MKVFAVRSSPSGAANDPFATSRQERGETRLKKNSLTSRSKLVAASAPVPATAAAATPQTPPVQTALCVQGSPLLQAVPSGSWRVVQPTRGSQAGSVQGPEALQTTGSLTQAPASHRSLTVQASTSTQSALAVQQLGRLKCVH